MNRLIQIHDREAQDRIHVLVRVLAQHVEVAHRGADPKVDQSQNHLLDLNLAANLGQNRAANLDQNHAANPNPNHLQTKIEDLEAHLLGHIAGLEVIPDELLFENCASHRI